MVKPPAWRVHNGGTFLAALFLGVMSISEGAQELLAGGLKALINSGVLGYPPCKRQ
jgi:hypothetical protein